MLDRFNRRLNYLRISVTDRCNLRCIYCMPEKGIELLSHKDILTYGEITAFTKVAVREGVTKVKITGGEPLVRKGIVNLIKMISDIKGINDLSMTTNGILLSEFAKDLYEAGLQRVNISLDTIDPERFSAITRGGRLSDVLKGIEAARNAGLKPVKINCVKMENEVSNGSEIVKFCKDNDLELRFIRQMNLANGHFSIVEGGTGGNCPVCNRLRLTANGMLKPCLFDNIELNIRVLGYEEALRKAVAIKPACGSKNISGEFYNIGG